MRIVNIGFGNLLFAERIVGIVSPDSSPVKRLIKEASERGKLVDASYGRRTRSVIVTDSDHVVLSALTPEMILARISGTNGETADEENR